MAMLPRLPLGHRGYQPPALKTMDKSFYITTSVRGVPDLYPFQCKVPYNSLVYHQARMLAASQAFGWHKANVSLEGLDGKLKLNDAVQACVAKDLNPQALLNKSWKLRVLMDREGKLTVSASEVPDVSMAYLLPKDLSALRSSTKETAWGVFISPKRTAPSPYTKHKTTCRTVYDEVRRDIPAWASSAQYTGSAGAMPEILLVNTQGNIMEASITTPYFFRNGRWVTPPTTSGGNIGTTRRWALESGLCVEEDVKVTEVQFGESIWLSNSVRGWGLGIIIEGLD